MKSILPPPTKQQVYYQIAKFFTVKFKEELNRQASSVSALVSNHPSGI